MKKPLELVGKRFGRLVVLKREKNNKFGCTYWLCKCDCGKTKIIRGTHLQSGKIRSCGCLTKEATRERQITHNLSNTRLYHTYNKMKARCYRKTDHSYKDYGGRGIKICDEWLADFMNFYNWAIANGYREDLSIDRIDVNGNYEPMNCRWATPKQQSNNTRRCIYITYNNETHTTTEWGRILKIKSETIRARLHKHKYAINEILYNGNLKYYKDGKTKLDECPLEIQNETN